MNEARAIETALAETIRQYGDIGSGVTIRCWQALQNDFAWRYDKTNGDRRFPVIDIRAGFPMFDENQHTMHTAVTIEIATMTQDDRNHAVISSIYTGAKAVIDSLFKQFMSGNHEAEELAYFVEMIKQGLDDFADVFHFGGITLEGGMPPYDEGGILVMPMTINIHHARTDY